ncbi:MAG TPA: nucleotidyl transferase AbiEii/AbiGii toxin family protein [Candidatus Baltobacteraceae bacterium]|nr:nucleotidyl transferase AbiEii/AbiGii toxin family protein [Candidatus Baltobacteraceae bacterium]
MTAFKPNKSILPGAQRALWDELRFTVEMGMTLYGGTAIALRLGHRTSIDFDFFADGPLRKPKITRALLISKDDVVLQDAPDTLTVNLYRSGAHVKVSFFGELVPKRIAGRVGEPEMTDDDVLCVASLDDLFATKVKVILDRAEAKDYIDIAALIRQGLSLERALGAAQTIYGNAYQVSEALKALTYYGDGDLGRVTKQDRALLITSAARVRNIDKVQLAAASVSPA